MRFDFIFIDILIMLFIAHRINNAQLLDAVCDCDGIECDLRDAGNGDIVMTHDPWTIRLGEKLDDFIEKAKHKVATYIFNIKSEGIEWKVLQLSRKYMLESFFFLDCTIPMIHKLVNNGVRNVALRFSEYERFDLLEGFQGKVDWVWFDNFDKLKFHIEKDTVHRIKSMGYKICIVSPELQGMSVESINQYVDVMKSHQCISCIDAICTKVQNIEIWKRLINRD